MIDVLLNSCKKFNSNGMYLLELFSLSCNIRKTAEFDEFDDCLV